MKCFSDWIEHEPKEKWSLLHDRGGARYGVMTINLAEVYNWVMRGARSLPLVGIVEANHRGTMKYFVDRSNNASLAMANDRVLYSAMITKYMEEKSKNGEMHRAFKMGRREFCFEIMCRDKGRRGTNRETVTHECTLRRGSYICTCNKPLLLHRPCSHVIAACVDSGAASRSVPL